MLKGLFLIAFSGLTACSNVRHHSDILFIESHRLIDGVHDTAFADFDIIVVGGRIAGLGPNLRVPDNATVVDLKAFTVLPTPLSPVPEIAPAQAIRASTSVAAAALGLEKKVGSLSPGLFANMIAVEGNPLEDLSALQRVRVIVQEGVVRRP